MFFTWISIWTIMIVLLKIDIKTRESQWLAAITFFAGLGGLGVFLRENIMQLLYCPILNAIFHHTYSLAIALSYQETPYAAIVYAIITSTFIEKKCPCLYRNTYKIFLVPVIAMHIIYPFIPTYKPSYLILSIWTVPYIFVTNIILIHSFLQERDKNQKQKRLLVLVLLLPASIFSIFANYLLKIFDIQVWQYNSVVILLTFGIIVFLSVQSGALGIRVRFERYNTENTIKTLFSGFEALNKTIKSELITINEGRNDIIKSVAPYNDNNVSKKSIIEDTGIISLSIQHLTEMVNRMQENLRDIVLHESMSNAGELIDRALSMVNPLIKKKDIIVYKKGSFDRSICCDKLHITEVVVNILTNAIEAIKTNGEIVITVYGDFRTTTISINDNGVGIVSENLSKIINPFFSTKKSSTNFGLGLSYCYNVMRKHEGNINISSNKNVGTKVDLIFKNKGGIKDERFIANETILHTHYKSL